MRLKPAMKAIMVICVLFFLQPQDIATRDVEARDLAAPDMSRHERIALDLTAHDMVSATAIYSQLNCSELNYDAFVYALEGMQWLDGKGLVGKDGLVCIIDYSLPSTEKRLFIIDVRNPAVLFRTLVAHGQNTGSNESMYFSNRMGSHQSSLGFFTTGSTYTGQNGYSMQLDGLDTTFNEMARPRAIVMHGAPYVSEDFIRQHGRIGRSWGCPALPENESREIIDLLKGGSVIFGYYPDAAYFDSSQIIRAITL